MPLADPNLLLPRVKAPEAGRRRRGLRRRPLAGGQLSCCIGIWAWAQIRRQGVQPGGAGWRYGKHKLRLRVALVSGPNRWPEKVLAAGLDDVKSNAPGRREPARQEQRSCRATGRFTSGKCGRCFQRSRRRTVSPRAPRSHRLAQHPTCRHPGCPCSPAAPQGSPRATCVL